MKIQVKGDVINHRSKKLIQLSEKKKREYSEKIISKKISLSGIAETIENGYWTALSDHYLRVYFRNSENLKGKFLRFEPIGKFADGIEVRILSDSKDKSNNAASRMGR